MRSWLTCLRVSIFAHNLTKRLGSMQVWYYGDAHRDLFLGPGAYSYRHPSNCRCAMGSGLQQGAHASVWLTGNWQSAADALVHSRRRPSMVSAGDCTQTRQSPHPTHSNQFGPQSPARHARLRSSDRSRELVLKRCVPYTHAVDASTPPSPQTPALIVGFGWSLCLGSEGLYALQCVLGVRGARQRLLNCAQCSKPTSPATRFVVRDH